MPRRSERTFPEEQHTYAMPDEELAAFEAATKPGSAGRAADLDERRQRPLEMPGSYAADICTRTRAVPSGTTG